MQNTLTIYNSQPKINKISKNLFIFSLLFLGFASVFDSSNIPYKSDPEDNNTNQISSLETAKNQSVTNTDFVNSTKPNIILQNFALKKQPIFITETVVCEPPFCRGNYSFAYFYNI